MRIVVNKETRTPFYWQIADQIKEQVLDGTLTDGMVLPSERVLAKKLNVHRNTIIKAYNMLKDEELIDSFHGVGYKVTYKEQCSGVAETRNAVNWSNLIKDEYQDMERTFDDIYLKFTEENQISFSTGMPPAIYDKQKVSQVFGEILTEESKKSFYLSPYQGDMDLRKAIVSYLRAKGIRANLGQVQVLSETNQALDFIVTSMLRPGDKVILEEPVSPDVYRVIELAGGVAITVPVDEEGILCERLEPLIELHNPKFIYVNSSFHDPTGNVLSTRRRQVLLDLSSRYRLPIIEEDAASDLAFDETSMPMTIKSMDQGENVIYIYSFSLTFIPGMSMAFVVAPEKLIKSLSYLVSIRIISLDWLTQKLLAKSLRNGAYDENVKTICALNQQKRDTMCDCLDQLSYLGVSYKRPKGGVYIWCRLPDNIDGREVARKCAKKGVAIIPGEVFYPNKNNGHNYLRLNYSFETIERIKRGMEIFSSVVRELVKNE